MTPEASEQLLRVYRKVAEEPEPDVVVAEAMAIKARRGAWCCNKEFLSGDTREFVYNKGVSVARRKGHTDCLALAFMIRAAKHRKKAIQARIDAIECGYDLRADMRPY